MPANVPHKGLTVLDGRLDPKVWGRFPINNMLNGTDGQMILHGFGAHSLSPGDGRESAGTLEISGNSAKITTGANANDVAAVASFGKANLAGNRFVLECSLNLDAVADGAVLLGFAASRTDPLPDADSNEINTISDDSFGVFKKSSEANLYFASKVGSAAASLTDLDVDCEDGVAVKIKMVSDGKGNIEVSTDGTLRKKIAYPGVASGYLVLAVKAEAADLSPALTLGSIAFGVAE